MHVVLLQLSIEVQGLFYTILKWSPEIIFDALKYNHLKKSYIFVCSNQSDLCTKKVCVNTNPEAGIM